MLQAVDLSKRYEDGLMALDHLNLEVEEGEIFCLLGPNSAGKTTTINPFLNFIDPTDGTAMINGCLFRSNRPVNLEQIGNHFRYNSATPKIEAASDAG